MQMNSPLAIVLAVLLSVSAAPAQHASEQAHPDVAVLSLDFAGGTAADYVDAIRKARPGANIVVLGGLDRIPMSPVKLQSVDVSSALRVLDQIPQDHGTFTAKVRVENVATSQDVPDVFAVTADIRGAGGSSRANQTTIISMADLLTERLAAEDALAAVEASLGLLSDGAAPAEIRFHEETGLLIARGSVEQISTIREVVAQLRERHGAMEAQEQIAKHESQSSQSAKNAVAELRRAQDENLVMTRTVMEWKTRAEILQQELDQLRHQLAVVHEEARALRAMVQSLQQDKKPDA